MIRTILLTLMCLAPLAASRADDRPNVLFIAVDDLNDWIGCLGGHPQCQSPHIDALAERGVLFTRSYCAAPACNPSRAALLTGIRPWSSGVYHNPQPWRPAMPEAVTLPQHFMAHGYEAVGCGKIFHGRYDEDASWNDYLHRGPDPKPSEDVLNDPHSRAGGIVWGVLDVEDSAMNDYQMVDYAIDYLRQDHEQPFFLACGIYRPHMPWQVPRDYYEMYPLESVVLPEVPGDDLDDIPPAGVRMARPEGDHRRVLETDNWSYAVQAYLASISFADAQVGRLIDALDESAYADDTIIVLWGDHGWHLGEKQHWRKFALWEEATRAPLLFVAPGVTEPGTRCERTVDFMSIYPTLCELCELPFPGQWREAPRREGRLGEPSHNQLEGPSILSLLEDPAAAWDRPAVTTHGRGNHAVRSERFRYIRYSDGGEELYDHDADPMEWRNLADDRAYAPIKEELAASLPEQEAENAPRDR